MTSDPIASLNAITTNRLRGLLGIHFAQFTENWDIEQKPKKSRRESNSVPILPDGYQIKGLSGMTCVLPAWSILEVLNSPKHRQLREHVDDAEASRLGSVPTSEGG